MIGIHICIFTENTHPNKQLKLIVGGIENQILNLLSSYEKINNINISIVTKYSKYVSHSGKVKIYEIHKFKNLMIDSLYFNIKSLIKIIKIHRKNPIDILNVHTFTIEILVPYFMRLLFKIPLLMKIPIDFESHLKELYLHEKKKARSTMINISWFNFFREFVLKKINYVRAVNNKILNDLIKKRYPEDRIILIPNGVDVKQLLRINKKSHKGTHFGYVGRLTKFKNLRFLLEVFKNYLLENFNDKLFIYGTGPEERFISDFVKENNLIKSIILCGFEKDKEKIYSNIDVIIDPAFSQGISNSVLESMSTNTFVIASNVEGNKDLIENMINGLLFNPLNKNELLNCLKFYKDNKELVQVILKKAYLNIKENYDINIVANKIYSFLRKKLK